jgi:hypothetical protein
MKKLVLHTLLAAGVFSCGASLASAAEPVLVRQAQSLACLAAQMDEAFHEDLRKIPRYRSITRAELGVRASLCQLSNVAAQFRQAVDQPGSVQELERSFGCVQEAFTCVRESMVGVPMSTDIRGMLQQFAQATCCVEHINLEAHVRYHASQPHDDHDHHGHRHGPDPHSEVHARGIFLRVPVQSSAPFIFRQPIR